MTFLPPLALHGLEVPQPDSFGLSWRPACRQRRVGYLVRPVDVSIGPASVFFFISRLLLRLQAPEPGSPPADVGWQCRPPRANRPALICPFPATVGRARAPLCSWGFGALLSSRRRRCPLGGNLAILSSSPRGRSSGALALSEHVVLFERARDRVAARRRSLAR